MSEYFRDVPDARRLIAPERAPVTGRRVPKQRSKRTQRSSQTGLRAARPWVLTGAAVATVTAALIGVVVASSDDDSSIKSAEPSSTIAAASGTTDGTAVASVVETVASSVTTSAATEPSAVETSVATTVAPATTITVAEPVVTRLVASAAATAAEAIATDPAGTASFSGPLPLFTIPFDCTGTSCVLSIRDFFPGAITADGLTTAPVTGDRVTVTTTRLGTCTASDGTQYTREHVDTIDLVLSGVQDVGGVLLPAAVDGTLTLVTPDAGYVPKVGDVVDEGATQGCAGQTLIFTVSGPIAAG